VRSPFTELPTVFLYDAIPGGVGLADKLYDVRSSLIDACMDVLRTCECEAGCPSCVGAQVEPRSVAKKASALLLQRLVGDAP
jgi:DEAD/DEAH box helicase domain-containing protein